MDQFINQPAANWARHYLQQPVEVKIKEFKVILGICIALLGLIFGGIALLFFASAVLTLKIKGWDAEVTRGLVGGIFFLFVFAVFGGGLMLLGRMTRRKFARYISAYGVQTRGGQKLRWEDLYYLDYKGVANTRVYPGGVGTAGLVAGRVGGNLAQEALFAGVEKVTIEMVFANGTAVIPPLIKNQPEVLALLNSIPVQRRDDGKIRQ